MTDLQKPPQGDLRDREQPGILGSLQPEHNFLSDRDLGFDVRNRFSTPLLQGFSCPPQKVVDHVQGVHIWPRTIPRGLDCL
jgi:hypothetical protein